MSPHQTIAVAVRLFAIWLVLYFTRDIFAFYFDRGSHDHAGALVLALAVFLVVGAACLALWFFPLSVARKILTSSSTEPASPAPPETWLTVGCALLGLWVLSSAVPLLVRDSLIQYIYRTSYNDVGGGLFLLRYVGEILIAVWLVLGAKGIGRLFRWARGAGVT
jgi:hypothetical protein